jgi:SAM-dependent methyltransferase
MWNDVYSCDEYYYGTAPNDFLAEHISKLHGRILSLAEGEGRNAVFMAEHGLDVRAVDGSATGLAKANTLAASRKVAIQTEVADLNHYAPAADSIQGVVSIFAHLPSQTRRQLHQRVEQALQPGGIFLLEGYSQAQLPRNTGGPKNPDMLFSLDELLGDFYSSELLLGRELNRKVLEGRGHTGVASVVQLILKKI